jgi:hypothetical protein
VGLTTLAASFAIGHPSLPPVPSVSEIASADLAMMAIFGMFHHDGLPCSAWGVWALLSPPSFEIS